MKTIRFFSSLVFTFCFFILGLTASAQNIWKGGTPGAETDWNTPRNWSLNRVPDWSDDVVLIPNVASQSGYFPVVESHVPDISHLNIEGGASVTITTTGSLTIDGETTFNYGIQNTGHLHNSGHLAILKTALPPLAEPDGNILNQRVFAFEIPNENARTLMAQVKN